MFPRRLSQKHAVSMMIQKGASFGFFSGEENQLQNDFFFFLLISILKTNL